MEHLISLTNFEKQKILINYLHKTMKFDDKTFNFIKSNHKNALLWGQKMWFILTDVYKNNIDKARKHQLWLENITLALIYHEFLKAGGLIPFDEEINWHKYITDLEYDWDSEYLIFLAGDKKIPFSEIENFDETKKIRFLVKLIYDNKKEIFYQLVKHYFSVNDMYEELVNSLDKETKAKFDINWAWEWAREEFSLFGLDD